MQWPACGPLPKCHHSMQHVGHMRNVGKTKVRQKKWTVAHIRASFGLFGWLTCGNAKAYLRPKSGKQEQTGISLHRMWARARCWIWTGSGPELKSMWPTFGPVLLLFGLFMAYIGLSFGLLVAQIWQTGVDRRSAIILRGMWARLKYLVWSWSGPQEFCYLNLSKFANF